MSCCFVKRTRFVRYSRSTFLEHLGGHLMSKQLFVLLIVDA